MGAISRRGCLFNMITNHGGTAIANEEEFPLDLMDLGDSDALDEDSPAEPVA